MNSDTLPPMSPSEFVSVINQTLEYAYPSVLITGEVASFKVNQGKWVFFDVKDEETSIPCFMSVYQLRVPLEDGMRVVVRGIPKLTKWGKFSFTVNAVKPVGEGSIKKAFELLKKKLGDEGLFDAAKKRMLPKDISKIGVISSTQAAGYADFIKILNERWGRISVKVAHTQVQGIDAPEQIIKALKYFNEHEDLDIIAIIRGGGSADDLSCFNDEALVRAIAASKIPVITGIGHEVDESLSDLAADVRGSTPSNVAEMLTPDREDMKRNLVMQIKNIHSMLLNRINTKEESINEMLSQFANAITLKINEYQNILNSRMQMLSAMNPENVLKQGYAILSGKISPGSVVKITTFEKEINAEIKDVYERK